jgi:hypothetical protein
VAQKHNAKVGDSYHFRRAKQSGLIQVFNQDWYLMAEYSEHTGAVSWQRITAAPQRAAVEQWLRDQFPVVATAAPAKVKPAAKKSARDARSR